MEYKPKIITGRVAGTGWPIDGHTLCFSQWDYDPENWHLYGWDDADDEAVMLTVLQTENEAGLSLYDTLEDFTAAWKAKKWEPQGSFVLEPDKVEIVEVKQEEQKNDTREKLLAHGIDLRPRKDSDKGGILCLPLDKNLNGNTQANHPDWQPMKCPACGQKCWKHPEADKLQKEQAVQLLCTECVDRRLENPSPGSDKGILPAGLCHGPESEPSDPGIDSLLYFSFYFTVAEHLPALHEI